jgi:hypothetical protein
MHISCVAAVEKPDPSVETAVPSLARPLAGLHPLVPVIGSPAQAITIPDNPFWCISSRYFYAHNLVLSRSDEGEGVAWLIETWDLNCEISGSYSASYKKFRLLGYKNSAYLTGDTLRLHYTVQPVNAM